MQEIEFVSLTIEDLELVRKWRNSDFVSQYMYTNSYINELEQIKWFSKISNSKDSFYWLIKLKNTKIGVVNITNIDFENNSCNWAYYIGELDHIGMGVGVKTEFQLIEKVFFDLKLNLLNCEVISENIEVISLHKKFGFKETAYLKNFIKKNSIEYNIVKLSLLKNDWLLKRESLKKLLIKI
jgi:UDP-4-amino-4,6-dideoxy-N-acetyl-beta-L-altrosamine N-acetyltransferase